MSVAEAIVLAVRVGRSRSIGEKEMRTRRSDDLGIRNGRRKSGRKREKRKVTAGSMMRKKSLRAKRSDEKNEQRRRLKPKKFKTKNRPLIFMMSPLRKNPLSKK